MRRIAVTTHDEYHAEIYHFVRQANRSQSTLRFDRFRLTPAESEGFSGSPIEAGVALERADASAASRTLDAEHTVVAIVTGNLQDDEDDEYFVLCSEPRPDGSARAALVSPLVPQPGVHIHEAGRALVAGTR